ncbi:hypothetical protein K9857_05985 [Pseudomonas sp. REP124]|uniref:type IV toxin-antitoxin system AbiEi family antitoxin n=1 Tax=Pseudomonas sp. REP124 TaxID=2875731 RepID=UPI001CC99952|nr:type IV toxin-antitoxin system AbiEi family antitoxin [Pseudomonas sp. REP124]MBZ9781099.1 hypothetical protein [Pseudomonas sp. REP124]
MRRETSDHDQQPLIEAFVESLQNATGTQILDRKYNVPGPDGDIDLLLRINSPDGPWDVAVEMKRVMYPRDVREAVWILDRYRCNAERKSNEAAVVPMVLAEQLSSGAREDLKRRGVGYYDSSGSLYFRHNRWLINIERKPSTTSQKQRRVPLFTGAREMVVHALLQTRGEWFTGLELAETSQTSVFSVSSVLRELELREWIEADGKGRLQRRRLTKPGELLDAWADAWQKRKESRSRWYVFSSNPNQLLDKLSLNAKEAGEKDWAFTGAIAANNLSPLLTQVDIAEVEIMPGTKESFAYALGLKPAEKGANVVLVERSGSSMLFRRHHPEFEGWFASEFIQYLDLQDGRGRNAELAAQLRQDILKV